jgi:hypothetical protein
MKLLLLFSVICLLNKTHSLTSEEEISLNNRLNKFAILELVKFLSSNELKNV